MQHTFPLEEDSGRSSVGFWQEPGPRRRGYRSPSPAGPNLLAPGTSSVANRFVHRRAEGGGGFRMSRAHSVYCALYFCPCYTSSASGRQALDPGGCRPLL